MSVDAISLSFDPLDGTEILDDVLVKTHLAVDGSALDPVLALYQQVAIQWAEDFMQRAILVRPHVWTLRSLQCGRNQRVHLPRGRCTAVTSIVYTAGGTEYTLTGPSSTPPGTDYQEDLASDSGGTLMPARGRWWPFVDGTVPAPVRINFLAGYEPEDVPANIKHALLFAMSDMLELRGSADLATLQTVAASGRTLQAREELLDQWRIRGIGS